MVKRSKVFGYAESQHPSQLPPSTSIQSDYPISEELLQFLSKPILPEENWTEDIDSPLDLTEDMDENIRDAEPGRLTLEEGLALLHEIDSNPSVWPTAICSHVIMDIWHAIACIKVPKEHGL